MIYTVVYGISRNISKMVAVYGSKANYVGEQILEILGILAVFRDYILRILRVLAVVWVSVLRILPILAVFPGLIRRISTVLGSISGVDTLEGFDTRSIFSHVAVFPHSILWILSARCLLYTSPSPRD